MTGKTGAGKSTLVNGIVGEKVAEVGDKLDGVTKEVKGFKFEKGGTSFLVFDSPGLQDVNLEDADTLEQIRDCLVDKCGGEVDLLVYCLDMRRPRIETSDITAIRHLTEGFSTKLWKNAVFALTFANDVKEKDRTSFQKRLAEFEEFIKKYVKEQVRKLNSKDANVVDTIPVVPAGYWCTTEDMPNQRELPDRKDWFNVFWFTCANRMNGVSGLHLILSQASRMKPESERKEGTMNDQSIYIDDNDWKKFLTIEGLTTAFGGILGYTGFTGALTVGGTNLAGGGFALGTGAAATANAVASSMAAAGASLGTKLGTIALAVTGGPVSMAICGLLGLGIGYAIYCQSKKK